MSAIDYRIWAGPSRRTSKEGDITEFWDVGIHAQAKRNTVSDYEIANELIATHLGQHLGLPIPAGVGLEMKGVRYFASLFIAATGERLPPGNATILVEQDSFHSMGTILFDSWICNFDRHSRNFFFEEEDRQLYLIDHGGSLFGANGLSRLREHRNQIGIYGSTHEIASSLESFVHFDEWDHRLRQIPDHVVRHAVQLARGEGLEEDELSGCAQFLIERKSLLRGLFAQSQDDTTIFPRLNGGLFKIREDDDQDPENPI